MEDWCQYWPVYVRLEQELCDLTFVVALEDCHLKTYSIKIAELLFRACSEVEDVAKALVRSRGGRVKKESFRAIVGLLGGLGIDLGGREIEIVWPYCGLSQRRICPFDGVGKPVWYKAYNDVKHNRAGERAKGNLSALVAAVGGLFVLNVLLRKGDIEGRRFSRGDADEEATRVGSRFFEPQFVQWDGGGTVRRLAVREAGR